MVLQLNDNHTVELYDSLVVPCTLENEMNGYIMQEIGIGSKPHNVLSHIQQALSLIDKNPTGAKTELENARFAYQNAVEGYNAQNFGWACLVKSVDGVLITDHSETALKALVDRLAGYGLTNETISDTLDEVKKKLIGRIDTIFPSGINEVLTPFSDMVV